MSHLVPVSALYLELIVLDNSKIVTNARPSCENKNYLFLF